ncbi:MAG: hypothetical protein QXG39_03445 [Candidatus Aenigmatarchaeota archaeon]
MRIPLFLKKDLEFLSLFGIKSLFKNETIHDKAPLLLSESDFHESCLPRAENSLGIMPVRMGLKNFFYVIILKNIDKCGYSMSTFSKKVFPILNINDGYHFYEILKEGINKVKQGKHVFKFYLVVEAKFIPLREGIEQEYSKDKEEFLSKVIKDREIFLSFVNFFRFKSC